MKSSSDKPRTIKQNPAKQSYFHQKRSKDFNKPFDLRDADYKTKKLKALRKLKENSFDISSKKNRLSQTDSVSRKNWWTPIWSGLVLDNTGKHKKAIRHAIWLYLYLLTVANRQNGTLFRRISTITSESGFQMRSVQRWLKLLRDENYIETRSNGRYLNISINKWKPITRKGKSALTKPHN